MRKPDTDKICEALALVRAARQHALLAMSYAREANRWPLAAKALAICMQLDSVADSLRQALGTDADTIKDEELPY